MRYIAKSPPYVGSITVHSIESMAKVAEESAAGRSTRNLRAAHVHNVFDQHEAPLSKHVPSEVAPRTSLQRALEPPTKHPRTVLVREHASVEDPGRDEADPEESYSER